MSKTTYVNANVTPTYDTFAGWLTKTNQIIYDMGNFVVTTSNTSNPDVTVGNSFINGYLGANVVYVTTTLQGGTANTPAALSVASVLTVSNTASFSGNVGITGSANVSVNVNAVGLLANNITANNNLIVSNTATLNVATVVTANITSATISGTANVGTANVGTLGVTGATTVPNLNIGTAATANITANSSTVSFANASATATINATNYSGTSNNATYHGGVTLAALQTQITGNAATAYTNATSYADTKAATAYTNAVSNTSYQAGVAYTNAIAIANASVANGFWVAANATFAANAAALGGIVANTASPSDGYVLAYDAAQTKLVFKNPAGISAALNANNVVPNVQLQAGSNGTAYVLNAYSNATSSNLVMRANNITLTVDSGAISLNSAASVSGTLTVATTATVNGTVIAIGNNSVNTQINATSFSGTANNALYLGGTTLGTIQTQITGNAASAYANAVANAAALYQTTAGLSANVATLTANAAGYLGNSSGTIANITSWISGNAATAFSNAVANAAASAAATYQTTAGLSANVATLTANNTNNLGGAAASAYVNTSGAFTVGGVLTHNANLVMASGNATNQLLIGTINATSIGLAANSTVLTIGNNSVNTQINATSFSGTANNASFLGGTTLATLQNQITGNAATAYSNAVANAAALYQTTAGLSANVLTLTSNNSLYLGGAAASVYVNTSGSFTLSGVQTFAANVSLSNNYIKQAAFAGYSEAVYTLGTATGTLGLDASLYNFFALTLTGNITISPTNVPAGKAVGLTIIAKQDSTGGRTITWPANTKWAAGTVPPATTTANATDIWVLTTYDGGTTWFGSLAGKAMA